MKSDKYYIFCISIIKSLKFNQVATIMGENMIMIKDPKNFCFNFDLPKDIDENLKCEIEFSIKNTESLAEIIITNEIE